MDNYIEITPEFINEKILYFQKGGEVPNEVKSDLDFLKSSLLLTSNEIQKAQIQKAIDNIESKYSINFENSLLISEDPESIEQKNEYGIEMLIDGNWYKKHNDKVLGTYKLDNSRYGKEIKVVIGTISDLNKIDVQDDFDQFIINKNLAVSSKKNVTKEISEPENESFIKDIISKSKTSIGNKAVAKIKQNEELSDETISSSIEKIQTIKQIYHKLNPEISKSEIQSYVWYKENIGQKLSNEWYELCEYELKDNTLKEWIEQGLLFYFEGNLIPKVIYLSGDIYTKINRIVKTTENNGVDSDYILNNYGPKVLQQQIELINNKYAEIYSKRLIITGNDDGNSLIIKPISDLAYKFKVTSLNDFKEFKWWTSKGLPNWDKEDGRNYQKEEIEELSLKDAFCFYLVNVGKKLEIKGNITYRDIIYFYIDKKTKSIPSYIVDESEIKKWRTQLERTKAKAASEGNRLFLQFLADQLLLNDKVRLETSWNGQFNNYIAPDFNKIPVAFNVTKEFYGEVPFEIKPEKREAVSFLFNEGSGCLAYDVGVGKTMSAIMTTEQFLCSGYSKRPLIVVPNQTFKQWISEIKGILPHRIINPLFNLGKDFIEEVLDENNLPMMVAEGSITVITYEGLKALGFNEETESQLMSNLYDILNQGGASEQITDKKRAGFREKLEGLIGRGLKGTVIPIESLGFDYLCFDEAHALKKVFTTVKGKPSEDGKKAARKQYSIESGVPSDTALKGFMLSQYILTRNNYRNVILLTATPFTNSPLEVFSMLSILAYHQLVKLGINNINDFFDTFIDADTDLVINHKLKPEYKQVIKGFNNLPSLQRIITRFFNYKEGSDVGVVRPNKIVIPYLKTLINNKIVDLPEDEKVSCYIPLNDIQKNYMNEIIAYAEGSSELGNNDINEDEDFDENEDNLKDSAAVEIDETFLSTNEKAGVRAIKAMTHSRNLALSPYLYKWNRLGTPTYKNYIENSPKLLYVIKCIESVKKYHKKNNEPISGQIIYMDRGINFFPLIKEYLVKVLGFEDHEVGMIYSKGMSVDKKRAVQDGFLGRKYNEKKQEYEDISDNLRIKVLIASSSIREGMNLQKKSTVLYNCFIDWNPTDMLQLQGRVWRQQNEFLYVRIVNPLMIDSIDIFMFQKLEEKTARINTIWSNDGRSVLKLEEIDPNEIKYALIKDPKIIAQIEIDEKSLKLTDDRKANEQLKERLDKFIFAKNANNNYVKQFFNEIIEKTFPEKINSNIETKFNILLKLFTSKEVYDSNGDIMLDNYENKYNYSDNIKKYGKISSIIKPSRPYWFDGYLNNKRLIEKETKDLLFPRNIDPEFVDDYLLKLEFDNKQIDQQLDFLKSKDYVEKRIIEIIDYRQKNKIVEKSIPEIVLEFERLNYLLSEKRISNFDKKTEIFNRLDENGNRKVDSESLKKLEKLVLSLPQTKNFYTDINGEYDENRKKVHESIIKKVKEGTTCVETLEPIAILTGGSPASGKSTFLKTYAPYLLSSEIFHIDADEIRAMLPEYEGWNAIATHLETKDIVNRLLTGDEIANPCKHDLIYDGTMNNTKNYLPLIGMLKSLGYKIFIVYMDNVPYNEVKKRMISKYETSGRFVPIEVIDDFFGKGKEALYELKNKVDGYMIVDAGSKEYKIIEEGGMKLPKNRNYSEIQYNSNISSKITEESEETQIKEAIEGLELLLEFSSKAEKKDIKLAISGLKLLM